MKTEPSREQWQDIARDAVDKMWVNGLLDSHGKKILQEAQSIILTAIEKATASIIHKLPHGSVWKYAAQPQRSELIALVDALEWYATATYPDDGSGRPPEAFQRRAKNALAKVKENKQ